MQIEYLREPIRFVQEEEFRSKLAQTLAPLVGKYSFVTGPGRSGAVASVYASHFLGVPYVPYKRMVGENVLIVDTAVLSGRTIRKASSYYGGVDFVYMFNQPPRVKFWYEELSFVRGKGNEYIRRTGS